MVRMVSSSPRKNGISSGASVRAEIECAFEFASHRARFRRQTNSRIAK